MAARWSSQIFSKPSLLISSGEEKWGVRVIKNSLGEVSLGPSMLNKVWLLWSKHVFRKKYIGKKKEQRNPYPRRSREVRVAFQVTFPTKWIFSLRVSFFLFFFRKFWNASEFLAFESFAFSDLNRLIDKLRMELRIFNRIYNNTRWERIFHIIFYIIRGKYWTSVANCRE